MPCDPQELISEAACFACVGPGFWPLLELQLLCEISESGGGGGGGVGGASFTSGLIDFGSGVVNPFATSIPHGLASTPTDLRVVIVCIVADAASEYAVGDEIDASQWFDSADVAPIFAFGANATDVFVSTALVSADYPAAVVLNTKTSGGPNTISSVNNFRLKFYAWT